MHSPVEFESCTIRSRGQVDSDFSSQWNAGKAPLFPFPSALRNFLGLRRAYGAYVRCCHNAILTKHFAHIRESESFGPCHCHVFYSIQTTKRSCRM